MTGTVVMEAGAAELTAEGDDLLIVQAHAVEHLAQVVAWAWLAIGPGSASSYTGSHFSFTNHAKRCTTSYWLC